MECTGKPGAAKTSMYRSATRETFMRRPLLTEEHTLFRDALVLLSLLDKYINLSLYYVLVFLTQNLPVFPKRTP
jgi:hypothetical protein